MWVKAKGHRWPLLWRGALAVCLGGWLVLSAPLGRAVRLDPLTPAEQVAKTDLSGILGQEYADMMAGKQQALAKLFLPSSGSAQDAFDVAWKRSQYWHAWAKANGIEWVGLSIRVRTPGINFLSSDTVRFFAVVQEQYRYRYTGQSEPPVTFGIGSRHYELTIHRLNQRWYIQSDDFVNPVTAENFSRTADGFHLAAPLPSPPTLGAQRAVEYADHYCGSAPGCGGGFDGRYNPRYRNFNGDGGDCTNFISQVLHAGGFAENGEWTYDTQTSEGSRAWSNADGLSGYLESSGRATLFAEGTYQDVTRATANHPRGAIGQLRIGDLISYEQHGTILHTAIVVGFDSHGQPLTDTHTNDRFHVPWEFGWKSGTHYALWHVHYPKRLPPSAQPSPQS